jgi:hypothetical protein
LAAPAAPTALSITKLGSFSARLSWSAPPGGANAATRYVIQAAMTNAFTSLVYNAPLGSATSLETNVPAGTFFVRILAQNGCGVSGPSNVTTLVSP